MFKLSLLTFILLNTLQASTLVLLKDDGININNIDTYIDNYNSALKSNNPTDINNTKNIIETPKKIPTIPTKIKLIDGFINCLDVTPGAYDSFNGVQYYAATSSSDIESKINEGFFSNNICTTHVTNMDNLLSNNLTFNQPINFWDTSNVTSMIGMLKNSNNYDQDIHMWNVSNVSSNHKGFAKGSFIYGTNKSPFLADPNVKLNANGVTIECPDATPGTTETFNGVQYYIASNVNDIANKINKEFIANNICTTHVTNMGYLFYQNSSFNQTIESWDTSNVISMRRMFNGASNYNQNMASWNTSNVTDMQNMLVDATSFNQNIHNWNVTNVNVANQYNDYGSLVKFYFSWNSPIEGTPKSPFYKDLVKLKSNGVTIECPDAPVQTIVKDKDGVEYYIAKGYYLYYGVYNDISSYINGGWPANRICTTHVIDFKESLAGYKVGNINPDISSWDTSNSTNMSYMFYQNSLFNQDLIYWDTSKVINMNNMFTQATNFNGNISNWNVSNVKYMPYLFAGATSFNQPIGGWNLSSVISVEQMFWGASSFNQSIENWNMPNVTSLQYFLGLATSFNQPMMNFNISNVTNMSYMFYGATSFNQYLNNWNTTNVTNMGSMFEGASSFNQDLSDWNINNARSTSEASFARNSPIQWDYGKNPFILMSYCEGHNCAF